ncbi:MAG: aspartate--tRNA ligase [Candidatus Melainabacteria bacterium RIFOXYA12_FULL_32_12]|nr:MAG: aspartate--tRNA ligase [Candidatus Melainabacteria bacterium RIFOXYA2_FULL_32_9]OGI30474.1 MAG: aspartate--tRNA ligase [Candidatus Melainabacteria bacterium RIFOXYA12_FULL_32_12]
MDNTKLTKLKTNWCGRLSGQDTGKKVSVAGWVSTVRDLGGIIFVEVRDRSGMVQIVSDPTKNPDVHKIFEQLKDEFVIQATGTVTARPAETYNPNLLTGEIEIYPDKVEILNESKLPPFIINDEQEINEDLRLKYRYLDIRRPKVKDKLILRHLITSEIRDYLNKNEFIEVETPILIKTTPEGARDYLVPSRVHPSKFYALPQSPQIFKQLLMVGGIERYYQIARCFRDEDLRADRQPEFTQVDIEMSFIDQEDIINLLEGLIIRAFKVAGIDVSCPFPRITHKEAMETYGSDRPDTRFDLKLFDVSDIMENSAFTAFADQVKAGGTVRALCAPGISGYSRKEMDDIRNLVVSFGAKGLAWITYYPDGTIKSPVLKYLSEQEIGQIQQRAQANPGDIVFLVADKPNVVFDVLGRLRLYFGNKLNLIDDSKHNLLWVVDFPMFEWDEESQRYAAVHHPFTSPNPEDITCLETDPLKCRAQAYDIVYNGNELGGGSIRIHNPEFQQKVFEILGLSKDEISEKFGFMIEAFKYGTPPHGGIALGLDRLVALVSCTSSIRDVIAFPKNSQAKCLMTDAPANASQEQLKELHIKLMPEKGNKQ